jgi:hypothetical protein
MKGLAAAPPGIMFIMGVSTSRKFLLRIADKQKESGLEITTTTHQRNKKSPPVQVLSNERNDLGPNPEGVPCPLIQQQIQVALAKARLLLLQRSLYKSHIPQSPLAPHVIATGKKTLNDFGK